MITRIVLVTCVVVLSNAAFEGEDCTAGGVAGTCARLPKCPSAIEAIKRRERPVNCGFDGATPIVCCVNNAVPTAGKVTTQQPPTPITTQKTTTTTMYIPETPIYVDTDRSGDCEPLSASLTTAKTGQKAFDKCIDYQRQYVYPCERSVTLIADVGDMSTVNHCHHNADELIIGGNDTAAYEFPHMVMLGYGEEQSISWLCDGSIISENYVLTAGHCISTRLGDVRFLLVGALTRSDANDPANIYKVKRIIKHPDYESPSKYNDIALLETEKRIALSQFVVPACLHVGDPVDDTKVLATGWGLTEYKGSLAEVMQKVTEYIFRVSLSWKSSARRSVLNNILNQNRTMLSGLNPETQTCYGDRNEPKDTCKGDSGGPIQIKSKKIHCMYTVVGVTSSGKTCGVAGKPGIYTRVAHYLPWIESIVWR